MSRFWKRIREKISRWFTRLGEKIADAVVPPLDLDPEEPQGGEPEPDGTVFHHLRWDRGGFNGSRAVQVDGAVIAGLKVTRDKMFYRWDSGGCELLGAHGHDDANCLACLFCLGPDGVWHGGKFDWISTSRTFRGLENIHTGYHGWSSADLDSASGYAFVIVSRDGALRTNVIKTKGPRG